MKKITILVPVYNERENLLKVLEKLEALDFGMEKEIIIIDDCSTDGTEKLYQGINHKVFYHTKNSGKGASLRTGIKNSTGDIIIIQDADLEYNPKDYVELVNVLIEEDLDVVYGSRFVKLKNNKFLPLSFLANIFLSFITSLLFRIRVTDMETCYKVFRADLLRSLNLKSTHFEFEPEVTAKIFKRGCKFAERPISYCARKKSQGKKITWRDGFQALWILVKYRLID